MNKQKNAKKINELVYELYGLSGVEIGVVESES